MSAKIYEVFIPISGIVKIHLRSEDRDKAVVKAFEIAKEMERDGVDTVIPNLFTWKVNEIDNPSNEVYVMERGESDE